MTVLSSSNLAMIAATVPVPSYDRERLRTGIVHIGVGGFHRAHEAMYIDSLMERGTGHDWGITGVGLLPGDRRMADVMAKQDCLYTLVLKHPDGLGSPGSSARWSTTCSRPSSPRTCSGSWPSRPRASCP